MIARADFGNHDATTHVLLALGALATLAIEWRLATGGQAAWAALELPAAGIPLWFGWRRQARLSLSLVLGIALAMRVASILLFRHLGYNGDQDPNQVYLPQGHRLLDGHYPRSEYPAGGVLLFALEAAVEPDPPQIANAIVMLPFYTVAVCAIWWLRTRWSAWLATVIALWPLGEYYWEFRYDAAAAGSLAAGLLLAQRRRWGWSGVVLGAGACFKWTPALATAVLVAFLLTTKEAAGLRRHVAGFVGVCLLVYVPLLVRWPVADVLASFRLQSGRPTTQESLWFWPARVLGFAHWNAAYWSAAGTPRWFDIAATIVQVALVATVIATAARARGNLPAAISLAALAPVVFLITNRVFSLQFVLVLAVGWAVSGAFAAADGRDQLLVGAGVMTVIACNAFMYPYDDPTGVLAWPAYALPGWIAAVVVTGFLLRRAGSSGRLTTRPETSMTEIGDARLE